MFYVLIVLMLLGWVMNIFSKKYALHNVIYQRKLSQTVVEIGEEFEITTSVTNNKFLPVTFLQVEEKFPAILQYKFKANVLASMDYIFHKSTFLLRPFERVSRVYTVVAQQRGKYIFRDVTLESGDMLGLDTSVKAVELHQEIVVLPQALPLSQCLQPYGDFYGDISVQRWIIEDPMMLTGIREYTGLEPERIVHWPSTLRTGQMMVKKFDYTADNSVMLILNIECAKPFWSNIHTDKIERCISLARGVVDELEQSSVPYGLCTNAHISGSSSLLDIKRPGIGTLHYWTIVESLGRMTNNINLSFEEVMLNFTRFGASIGTFVLITPAVLQPYIYAINSLSNIAKVVLITLEPANTADLAADILLYGIAR